jgi:hypothetical protein
MKFLRKTMKLEVLNGNIDMWSGLEEEESDRFQWTVLLSH